MIISSASGWVVLILRVCGVVVVAVTLLDLVVWLCCLRWWVGCFVVFVVWCV